MANIKKKSKVGIKKVNKSKSKSKSKKNKSKKLLQSKKKIPNQPKGYNTVTPYLIVHDAAEAIHFYKIVFSAKQVMRMEMPNNKIAHAELKIGDSKIMLADENAKMTSYSPKHFTGTAVSINLYVKNVDKVVDMAINRNAQLVRSVETMFYGDRVGTIIDPFGHQWHVATHVENVTPAKIRKRAAAMFNKNKNEEKVLSE